MPKKTGTLIGICGCHITIDEKDLGFEEVECQSCGTLSCCPETWEEVEKQNAEAHEEIHRATHVRVMALGEDGVTFCIKNMLSKDLMQDDLYKIILAGYQSRYPNAKVWTEDEECTVPAHHRFSRGELELY
jgi:hypothetical protein